MPSKHLPTSEEINKCLLLCSTSAEGAEYLYQEVKTKLTKLLDKENAEGIKGPITQAVDILRKNAENLRLVSDNNSERLWQGLAPLSNAEQNTRQSVAMAVQELAEIPGDKLVDFYAAVRESTADSVQFLEFVRGYLVNGQEADPETIAALDKIVNAWLATNHVVNQNGRLYQATENGDIKKDANGNPVDFDPKIIMEMMNDSRNGLKPFAENNNKGLQLNVHHPDQQPALQPADEAGLAGGQS